MQPEIKAPKQIIEAGIKKEITPMQQWDHLAFSVIYQELVPKGFKEIKSGAYRGSVQANIPFLSKKTVTKCQNIAAQLIRGFRDKSKAEMNKAAENLKTCLKDCKWYEFSAKRYYKANIEAMQTLVKLLDNVSIK